MNPSTALARVLVDELVRGGVREAVLSPGSRSAPLAFALHDADRTGRLRLHVRIDERSAAFLALGLAKESGRPVPVVTTSGTATANLHPAVLEASQAGVPLLLLTADRPPELRGSGANQTVDQVHLYGDAVRLFVEVGAPEERAGQNAYWRAMTCRALAAAQHDPGPVHLNLGLREPLVPEDGEWVEPLDGRPDGAPWTAVLPAEAIPPQDDLPARTVVVIGDCTADLADVALRLAAARGFPVVAEPSSSAWSDEVVRAAELVLGVPGWLDAHAPDRVLVVGRPTLSRVVARLVGVAPADVVGVQARWTDPARRASRVLPGVPSPDGPVDASWLPSWVEAGRAARKAVDDVLGEELSEPAVAVEVVAAAGDLLVVGSSKPVRDLFLAGGRDGLRVLANRGAAGIDGTVSTAVGAALAHGARTLALLGDLTFLHDANGLVTGPAEPRPDLTIVVVNNDGGAIFGMLEQGAPEHAEAFERVFGTPHGVDLQALCAATRTPYSLATSREQLRAELHGEGLRVVEVRTDRAAAVALDRELREAVRSAL
ncbi:MAG: 2-succinyl-6-hydroxy-2,4-cyclohexadiene-carboxylic acid synthase/2-oxoglutarate decarboxylase [Frankiales bacterium]|nr:2-succinyl-6-hydroxy-2,4-cyclohexadiene-carboxylic acid synthase/2-oxoglutarate decarboxylase [Frankiales bacterium]